MSRPPIAVTRRVIAAERERHARERAARLRARQALLGLDRALEACEQLHLRDRQRVPDDVAPYVSAAITEAWAALELPTESPPSVANRKVTTVLEQIYGVQDGVLDVLARPGARDAED